jgi:hypothetical protein
MSDECIVLTVEDAARLRADNERLREQVAALQASSGYEASIAQVEIERLRAELDDARLMIAEWQRKADRRADRIAELEAALEPKP